MDEEEIKRRASEIHQHNTNKAVALIIRDKDLRNLDTIFGQEVSEVYRNVIPRYAELCELDQTIGLNDAERAELAVGYASLYASFGNDGVLAVTLAWIATRSDWQARNN